ncbi:RNA polymerase sigma factor [Polyangium jinanense]|uniref:Sigma-70 family RNA polymerase sigma factor n=1 Tax=Polyangium jinanense TaxID=2829994 RepID=A0A9X4AWK0_9BACT|nr:sigma-70 family RNA polymerase sigma factor [Polyangium jinanense]MDC3960540.1 sigma-70 family RNA polymerase sigma factor [Polyangium jinanense]MDC3985402.1 sigma-70 family RNA polymerase sigma factor [Polyangium jinanense]
MRTLPVMRDDMAIVRGLRAGEPWARAALFDRCGPSVERIVRRILGRCDRDQIAELVHEVFVQAMASLDKLRDPDALVGWMQMVATHTVYKAIRARRARRWLLFWAPAELPEPMVEDVDSSVAEAFRRTYAALDKLPADERVAFVLRYVEGLEVERVAALCEVSLSTIKRRLDRAETRFAAIARGDEVLRGWLEEGGRWTTR